MTDRTVNVKLLADVAQYMASMRAAGSSTNDLEKAARDVRKAQLDQENAAGRVTVAQAKLNDIQKDGTASSGKLAVAQEQLAKAHRDLEVAQDNSTAAGERFRKAQNGAEDEAADTAKRVQSDFNAMQFTALSVGLPAAAAIGVAGAGLALTAIPALFVGIGIAANTQNAQVSGSFAAMTTNVLASTEAMATGMAGPLVTAIGDTNTAFNRIKPEIQTSMNASADAVKPLVGAVTDFAENAMPGFVAATLSAQAPLAGFRSFMGQTGSGVKDFFVNLTAGSVSAGAGLQTLGGISRDALGFLGSFLAQISNGSSLPLSQLQAMLRGVEGTLMALTSTGSGALGFLSGFSSGATGMLTVLEALSRGLSMLPPQLTEFAGSFYAVSQVASKFGIDAGTAFDGLGAKMKAAKTPSDLLKTSITGLAQGAMDPALLIVGALSVGMEILGNKQRDAAAAAQAQAERVQTLASALRESNGAIDDNVRATAAQTLATYKTSDGTRNLLADAKDLGVSLPTLTDAYLGNQGAIDSLNGSLTASVDKHRVFTGQGADTAQVVDDEGKKYQQFQNILNSGDFGKAVADNKNLAEATANAVRPSSELSSAMDELQGTAASAADRVNALKSALDILNGRTPIFEDAIKSGNDSLRNMAEGLKGGTKAADGLGKALINTDGTINTVSKNGSSLQGLAEGLQTSFADAASGIKQMTDRGIPFDQATKQVNQSLQTQRDSFIKVAGQMGINAASAKILADKYGLIPTAITTNMTANVKQAQDAISALPLYAAGVTGAVVVGADVNPATHNIDSTVTYADGSTGVISIDGHYDKATGKVLAAVHYADGETGTIGIDAAIAAAKAGTLQAVRFADGSTGYISVYANASVANAAIDNAARDRTANIYLQIANSAAIAKAASLAARGGAHGGVVGYAAGGIAGYASGGLRDLTPMSSIASVVDPNTWRVIGDNMTSKESYIPWDGSARSKEILAQTNKAFGYDSSNSVRQAIQSGTAVVQTPGAGYSSSAGGGGIPDLEAHVYIGDTELKTQIRTEIKAKDRSTKRAVTAGAGGSR